MPRRKKTRSGRASVAQIAPFSVPVKYLRFYVNQVGGVGGWLDLYPLANATRCRFCLSEQITDLPRAGNRHGLGLRLAFLVHAVCRQDVVRQHGSRRAL